MSKINGDYKYKYMFLEVENKNEKGILLDALDSYIKKLVKDIETESKSDYGQQRVVRLANDMSKCMEWKKSIEFFGTDTHWRDLDFYKNGIERFY